MQEEHSAWYLVFNSSVVFKQQFFRSSIGSNVSRTVEIKANERRHCNDALYLHISFLSFGNSRAIAFCCQVLG